MYFSNEKIFDKIVTEILNIGKKKIRTGNVNVKKRPTSWAKKSDLLLGQNNRT